MTPNEQFQWHRKYKDRMIEVAGLTEKEAEECLNAGIDDFDYTDDPADAADMEMSYWGD